MQRSTLNSLTFLLGLCFLLMTPVRLIAQDISTLPSAII